MTPFLKPTFDTSVQERGFKSGHIVKERKKNVLLSSALFQKSSGSIVIFKWYLLHIYALGIFSRISRTSNFSILRRNNKEIWPFYQQKSNILHTYLDPVATYLFLPSYLANLSDGESQLIVCGLQMTSYNGLLLSSSKLRNDDF